MPSAFISVEADITAAAAALEETGKSLKSIRRQVLRAAARGTQKTLKSAIRAGMKRGAHLAAAFTVSVNKGATAATVAPTKGKDGKRRYWFYGMAAIHNYGAYVRPKDGKSYLAFPDRRGRWHRVRSFYVPARHFIEKGEQYAERGGYGAEIQALIEKELKKHWGN